MPPHSLTNFEVQKYYQNEPKFNDVCSRNKLPKIKDGAYVTNLDEFKSIGVEWIALYVNGNNIMFFDRFRAKHIPKEIKQFIRKENVITNIYRISAYDSIMCGYFCIGFIDFMLTDNTLYNRFVRLYKSIFSRWLWKKS